MAASIQKMEFHNFLSEFTLYFKKRYQKYRFDLIKENWAKKVLF